MNRYGEAIRTQRLALGWSEKELARKAGITEKVLKEAESGKRILSEALAERLLACMCGPSETPVLNPYAAADTSEPAEPDKSAAQQPRSSTYSLAESAALGQVANIPIEDISGNTVGTRPVALEQGHIAGFAPKNVFYLQCPNDEMRGFRVHKGDMLLMARDSAAMEGAMVLLQHEGARILGVLVRVDQTVRPAVMDKKLSVIESMPKILARVLRVEFAP